MLRLHPGLPNSIMVLDRHTSIGDYARAYGDALARHHEAGGVIVIPFFPVPMDVEFLYALQLPMALKKMGSRDGIEDPVLERAGSELRVKQDHLLMRVFGNPTTAIYLQQMIARVNWQIRLALVQLFPRYHSLFEGNLTWRLCRTEKEGLHYDIYNQGRPTPPETLQNNRVKLFFNVDNVPRKWRVGPHLRDLLKQKKDILPKALPDDINVTNWIIDKLGALEDVPAHEVDFPPYSAWIGNSEVVAHEVVYGHRVIAAEYHCHARDMLNPALCAHTQMKGWLQDAGYALAPDAAAAAAPYGHLKGSYERALEKVA